MYWFHIACLDQNLTPNILFHIFLRSFLKQCLFSFSSPHPSYPYINCSNNSWVFPYRISNLFIFLFSLLNIPTPPPPPSYTSVLLPWVFFLAIQHADLNSPARDWTCTAPAVEAWSLNHWTTREVPSLSRYSVLIPRAHFSASSL